MRRVYPSHVMIVSYTWLSFDVCHNRIDATQNTWDISNSMLSAAALPSLFRVSSNNNKRWAIISSTNEERPANSTGSMTKSRFWQWQWRGHTFTSSPTSFPLHFWERRRLPALHLLHAFSRPCASHVRAHDTCRELVTAFDPTFALSTSTAITASTNTQEPLLLSDNHYKYCGRRAAMNMRPQGISELVLRMYGRNSHPSMPPQWHRKGVACGTILEALRAANWKKEMG
jgi:hypothetical protein